MKSNEKCESTLIWKTKKIFDLFLYGVFNFHGVSRGV